LLFDVDIFSEFVFHYRLLKKRQINVEILEE